MEPSCTTRLRVTLRYLDDVVTQLPLRWLWLRIVHVFFALAFPAFGVATLLLGIMQHDLVLEVCGFVGILVFPFLVLCLPGFCKLVYTLWFDLASLLLLIGVALKNIHGGVSNSFFAVGCIFMVPLVPFLLSCNICAPRNAAPPVPNLAVEYHAARNGAEERVAYVAE